MNDTDKRAIEEMAHDLCGRCQDGICVVDGKPCNLDLDCTCQINATTLYNAGYRKQREGEWLVKWRSTFPQYEPSEYECSNCGYRRTVLHKYCPNCGAKMKGGAE